MSHINPDFEWLYPDLLEKEDLIQALKKRYIRRDDLQKLKKPELVDLYHRYIIPLPQRKYRQNRRGRQMTKQQVQLAKKRRHSITAFSDSIEPPTKRQSSGGLVTSFEHLKTGGGDRLKPPPSCINFEKKTVKLSSSNSSSPKLSSSLDKLSLTREKPKSETNPDSPEKKLKTNDSDKTTSDLKTTTIKLINKQMEHQGETETTGRSGEESQKQSKEMPEKQSKLNDGKNSTLPTTMDTSDQVPKEKQKKIKITRIAWP